MKIITKVIVIITLIIFQLTMVACGYEQTDMSSKTDESKSAPQYVYNPNDIDIAKEQYDYVCSYTNAFGEKEYLFFNSSEAYTEFLDGVYYTKYCILGSDINLSVSGGCLYINEDKNIITSNESIGTYTEFSIQKLD